MPLSIEALLKQTVQQLIDAGSESPQLDAAVLLCFVLDKPRSYLLTWPEKKHSTVSKPLLSMPFCIAVWRVNRLRISSVSENFGHCH